MARGPLTGTLAAAVSPLRDGGDRLDEAALEPLVEFYGASGIDGLFLLGTTGEGVLLAPDERRRLTERTVAAAGGLRIAVHCGAQSTQETVALAAHAAEAGADAVAVIPPPYFAIDDEELTEHLAAAAAACAPLPFYAYEFAARSGYAISPAVLTALGERAPNLVGLKVSDTPYERVAGYLGLGLDVFVGSEPLIPQGLRGGAVGTVSGLAAAFPELVAELVRDPTEERTAQVEALRRLVSAERFQASVKVALGARGVPVRPDVRRPLRPLSPAAADRLRGQLEQLIGLGLVTGRSA